MTPIRLTGKSGPTSHRARAIRGAHAYPSAANLTPRFLSPARNTTTLIEEFCSMDFVGPRVEAASLGVRREANQGFVRRRANMGADNRRNSGEMGKATFRGRYWSPLQMSGCGI